MIYIGIDPGLSGAVAVLWDSVSFPDQLGKTVNDTPTLTVKGSKTKREYNIPAMCLLLSTYAKYKEEVLVVLESVHALPKQGVVSSFRFGEGLGIWKGILSAYELPYEMVSPQRWKKAMLADQGKDKDASRFKALALFPSLASELGRKKDDGRAESLLMAEYGRRFRKG